VEHFKAKAFRFWVFFVAILYCTAVSQTIAATASGYRVGSAINPKMKYQYSRSGVDIYTVDSTVLSCRNQIVLQIDAREIELPSGKKIKMHETYSQIVSLAGLPTFSVDDQLYCAREAQVLYAYFSDYQLGVVFVDRIACKLQLISKDEWKDRYCNLGR
jgi:hypothetical protein